MILRLVWLVILFNIFTINSLLSKERENQHLIVQVDSSEVSYKISILMSKTDVKVKIQAPYFWYANNRFFSTFGGYEGKLLDGKYTAFYKKGSLMESGSFSFGLKSGVWKKWDENGVIIEISEWKDGRLKGKVEKFYPDSKLKEISYYKNDKLHGKQIKFNPTGSIIEVLKFKNGKLLIKPQKKEKTKSNKLQEVKSSNDAIKKKIVK